METGALVPDDVTVRVVADRLARPDAAAGVILDGFPRTRPQAEALDELLARAASRVAGGALRRGRPRRAGAAAVRPPRVHGPAAARLPRR